ncbi:hypothetical protein [Massilia sp. TSP1-1-2]|uniref:hypothetical protein n=1 Tax=Massilia sp. TSP1-1-2 TaxID=2804649 RepID=UPI003CEF06F7
MRDYQPNPIIVDRAVELWMRALGAPVYRNALLGTPDGIAMAPVMALAAMLPKNNTPDILAAFGVALKRRLLEKQTSTHNPDYHFYADTLCVDYDPCPMLAAAAAEAGLKMEFPCKTHMWIAANYVSFSMGYGARDKHHYPMEGGRWLVTDLRGDDVDKVIGSIETGAPLGLTIEQANQEGRA